MKLALAVLALPYTGAFVDVTVNDGPDVVPIDNDVVRTCKPGDDLVVCDHHPHDDTKWVCDDVTEFHYCQVLCEDSMKDESTCVGFTFTNSQVECGGNGWEVCFNADFTNSEVICNNEDIHGTFQDAACYGAAFANSNVGCSSSYDCLSSTSKNSVVNCDGENSCFGSSGVASKFAKSIVNCSGSKSCGGSVIFTTSAVTCGDTTCEGGNIQMDDCSCCDGPQCPGEIPNCTDPEFCSSVYMGKSCAEWGNPICDKESFMESIGRQAFQGKENDPDIFYEEPVPEEEEAVSVVDTAPTEEEPAMELKDDHNNALFALLGLLLIPILVYFCQNKKPSAEVVENQSKPSYDTASEGGSADDEA